MGGYGTGAVEGVWGQASPTFVGLVSWLSGLFLAEITFLIFRFGIVGVRNLKCPLGRAINRLVNILDRYTRR